MSATLPQLIDSLRHELQQYGEMLALLEAQQDFVARGDVPPVLSSISAVEAQSAAIQAARQARQNLQRQVAWSFRQPEAASFAELIPLLPGEYQPLVAALVDEINRLLDRVREHADYNYQQLRRALELMERFLTTLSPEVLSARAFEEPAPLRPALTPV